MNAKIISSGKILYRGSHTEAMNARAYINKTPNYLRNLPVYFSNNRNNAYVYGTPVKYVTTKNIKLLNMGDINTVAALMSLAKSDTVKKSIEKAFRISNGIEVRRVSKIKYDIHVAVFICRLGYDGYYAPRLRTKLEQGYFHSEVVLCSPKRVLKVVKVENAREPPPLHPKVGVNSPLRRRVMNTNY